MKVRVGAISERFGASLDLNLERSCPGEVVDVGTCLEPIRLTGKLTNTGGCLVFRGELHAKMQLQCSRCLEPFVYEVSVPVEEEFRRNKGYEEPSPDGENELFSNVNYYQGETVEFDDIIRDNLMVNIPVSPVCKDECKGLCPVCGANRNLHDCGCKVYHIDPRLEGLGKLLK